MALKNMARRQVAMDDGLWSLINAIASTDTTSASAVVRKACKEYIAKRANEAKATKAQREREVQGTAEPAAV